VECAIQYSSKKTINDLEKKYGKFSQIEEYAGRFVRDGSIGQWKKYFDESELRRVELRPHAYGIELD